MKKKTLAERKKALEALEAEQKEYSELAEKLKEAQTAYEEEQDRANKAQMYALEQRAMFNSEQAGLLAESLADGMPCPVCGSREHPHKALKSERAPTEATVKKAERDAQEAQKRANEKSSEANKWKGQIDNALRGLLRQAEMLLHVRDLESLVAQLPREKADTEDKLLAKEKELSSEQKRQNKWIELQTLIPKKEGMLNKETEALSDLDRKLAAERAQLNELAKQLDEVAQGLVFVDKDAAQKAKKELEKEVQNLQRAIAAAEKDLHNCRAELAGKQGELAQSRELLTEAEALDIQAEEANLKKLETDKSSLNASWQAIKSMLENNKKTRDNFSRKLQKNAEVLEWGSLVDNLSRTVNGTLNGKPRIQLETYYQMGVFDRIILRANSHLMKMSNGKYDLKRQENYAGGGQQVGLDLNVIDHYCGLERSVKTLSGGETFIAALSLALGFSEEVQDTAGGIVLDTMYVDEGFGTLDDDALQQALKALDDLAEGNRLIGIISHVEELRKKIGKQIVVTKAGKSMERGSSVAIVG